MKISERKELEELRYRVNRLALFKEKKRFFNEVVNITNWVSASGEFDGVIENLKRQQIMREARSVDLLRKIYEESEKIWKSIKSQIPTDALNEILKNNRFLPSGIGLTPVENMDHIFANASQFLVYGIVHDIRNLVEDIAKNANYCEVVYPYVAFHITERIPLLSGDIQFLSEQMSREETTLGEERENSYWGAWDFLSNLTYMSQEGRGFVGFDDVIKTYSNEEYLHFLTKVCDFSLAYFEGEIRKDVVDDEEEESQILKASIWEDTFITENDTLVLGKYGQHFFSPDKNPNREPESKNYELVRLVVSARESGVLYSDITEKLGIKSGEIGSRLNSIEKGFTKSFYQTGVTVRFYKTGIRNHRRVRLLVLPSLGKQALV